jgi:hypothetical protein
MGTKCHYVQTRLTSDEAKDVAAICLIRGVTRSEYIRNLILKDIREALARRDTFEKAYPQQHDSRY